MNDVTESRIRNVNPLYQRLLGGVVLLALAALIIPTVFDLTHGHHQGITGTNIPPRPEGMRMEVLPLPGLEPVTVPHTDIAARIASTRPKLPIQGPSPGLTAMPEKMVVSPVPAARASSLPAASDNSSDKKQAVQLTNKPSWVVQVGSFANEGNAQALQARLRKAGVPARLHKDVHARRGGRIITRVWVGPYARKAAAHATRSKIFNLLKIKGIVIKSRPKAVAR